MRRRKTLLSRRENPNTAVGLAVKTLLKVKKRLNIAFLLKESLAQALEAKKWLGSEILQELVLKAIEYTNGDPIVKKNSQEYECLTAGEKYST